MRRLAAVLPVLLLMLGGCASVMPAACPVGQERLKTAQLFLGQSVDGKPAVSEAAFRRFVQDELTPRFPNGLTILSGAGQWQGSENRRIRDASKVVVIVLPARGDATARLASARGAYRKRFQQDSMLLLTPASCVSL